MASPRQFYFEDMALHAVLDTPAMTITEAHVGLYAGISQDPAAAAWPGARAVAAVPDARPRLAREPAAAGGAGLHGLRVGGAPSGAGGGHHPQSLAHRGEALDARGRRHRSRSARSSTSTARSFRRAASPSWSPSARAWPRPLVDRWSVLTSLKPSAVERLHFPKVSRPLIASGSERSPLMTARVSRRRFLQASAGAVAGLSLTALDRAPALAQKRELTFLSWNHFVPAADDELRRQAEVVQQAGRGHRARGHDRPPAAAGQARGGGAVAVGPRHAPHRRRRSVPVREPAGRHRRPRGRSRQEVGRLVPLRGRVRPDQVRLEGRALVLDLLSGHLQHGPLQEGRPRVPEDLGRAAPARQGRSRSRATPSASPSATAPTPTPPTGRSPGATAPRCSRPTARRRPSTPTRPPR